MSEYKIIVDSDKCIGCGLCKSVCAAHNIEIKEKIASVITDSCIYCGHCSAVCPKKAITVTGYAESQVENVAKTRLNPDEVLEVIRFRRSIRNFKDKNIPQETIDQILEAGRLTHTAKNLQDVSFAVLDKEKNNIEKLAVRFFRKIKPIANVFSKMARSIDLDDEFFFFDAPIVIVIFAKDKVNGILAAQNMEFIAEANGLGVLFSGFFTIAGNYSRKVKKAIKKPTGKKLAATLVIGYPDIKYLRSAQRKQLDVKYL